MIHSKNSFPIYKLPPFQQQFLTEDMLLFDIETTGLSAARDHIYCIGCGRREGDEITTDLFFAEQSAEETSVLEAFISLLRSHPDLITFNGTTFDIPFIRKRATLYGQPDPFRRPETKQEAGAMISDEFTFIDLYRVASGMKSLLRLPSYRQKSIEQFLGYSRKDRYDGGQLVNFYHQYINAPDPETLSLLLLHNEEDVRGMFELVALCSWYQLRDGAFEITDTFVETESDGTDKTNSFYNIKIRPELPFPQRIAIPAAYCSLLLDKEAGLIRFPIQHGTLKHFFPDPENYFYLPEEDCAVHKSVGAFVDPSHRRKATKQNCYSKQVCDYITAPVKAADCSLRREFRDICCYLSLPADIKNVRLFLLQLFSEFF